MEIKVQKIVPIIIIAESTDELTTYLSAKGVEYVTRSIRGYTIGLRMEPKVRI
jgi:hypothetical protein